MIRFLPIYDIIIYYTFDISKFKNLIQGSK